jgi:hypothetical protein
MPEVLQMLATESLDAKHNFEVGNVGRFAVDFGRLIYPFSQE